MRDINKKGGNENSTNSCFSEGMPAGETLAVVLQGQRKCGRYLSLQFLRVFQITKDDGFCGFKYMLIDTAQLRKPQDAAAW